MPLFLQSLRPLAVSGPPAASGVRPDAATFALRADGVFARSGLLISASGATAPGRAPLELSLDELALGAELGRGASGVVRRATHVPTGAEIALKCVRVDTHAAREALVNELRALWSGTEDERAEGGVGAEGADAAPPSPRAGGGGDRGARAAPRPLINTLLGACCRDGSVYLALELMDRGSLEDVCARRGAALPARALAGVGFCLFSALAALGAARRLHRDVKPSNVLLDASGAVALADFGLARTLGAAELATSFVGTTRYLAPERLRGAPYDYAADVWAAGATLWRAAAGRAPFADADAGGPVALAAAIAAAGGDGGGGGGGGSDDGGGGLGDAEGTFPEGLAALLGAATRRDAAARPCAAALLGAPFFAACGVHDVDSAMAAVREFFDGEERGAHVGASAGGDGAPVRAPAWAALAPAQLRELMSERECAPDAVTGRSGAFEIL
jgi:serine/threonine protein kinase